MSFIEGALKFIFGGTLILVISMLAKSGKGSIAGILAIFPVITALSFFFMSQNANTKTVNDAIVSSLSSLPATIAFLITLYLCASRLGINKSLAIGIMVWVLFAAIIYYLRRRLLY